MTTWRVEHGDCLDVMRAMPDASVDAVVTDPPYGLSFMGKQWDRGVPGVDFWREALRVAKPGAHLLAFGGTRTYHRLACAIEDAGWEIRDCLSWLYGSGFPKSHNGPWGGTALKPAWEPIILARKRLAGTVAANVAAHDTGALNIDGCRIATDEHLGRLNHAPSTFNHKNTTPWVDNSRGLGRWPANVLLDEQAAAALDAQTGQNVARFFYSAKASRRERDAGLEGMPLVSAGSLNLRTDSHAERTGQATAPARNGHPTCKPIALMRWLCRLVTPPGGVVLDPFTGSGSTGCAAVLEGFRFLGIEREAEYVAIAEKRIAHWAATRPAQVDLALGGDRSDATRTDTTEAA